MSMSRKKTKKDTFMTQKKIDNKIQKPDFIIAGAPRSGTTAMYDYLRVHPQIAMSSYKEPHYFGSDLAGLQFEVFRNKRDKYLKLFENAGDALVRGEGSIYSLFSHRAAQEMQAFNSDMRIVLMLRNPVEVLHSLYYHVKLTGDIRYKTFETMLEDTRTISADEKVNSRLRFLSGEGVHYAQQIQRFWDVFDKDQVHIIIYDDFRADTARIYQETLAFLDVDTGFRPETFEIINPAKQARNRFVSRIISNPSLIKIGSKIPFISIPIYRLIKVLNAKKLKREPLLPETKQQLQRELYDDVVTLSDMLGRDFTHWVRDA
jgi:hypothetical protein